MSRIVIDLETLSTQQDAIIMQIAALEFDEHGQCLAKFDTLVDVQSQLKTRHLNFYGTLKWWMEQAPDVRDHVMFGKPRVQLYTALSQLHSFCSMSSAEEYFSYGASFDISILEGAFQQAGMQPPWGYRQVADQRQLHKDASLLGWTAPPNENAGQKHDALADCIYQAACITSAMRYMEGLASGSQARKAAEVRP